MNEEVRNGHESPESDLRRDATSVDKSQGPKLWSAIQGNILGNSTGKDTHPEGMG